ncbi:hypothetical protein KVV02_006026 [Mortierella alpina]|uniref:Protein kinase domain-containing protein n=1 Tax=Mortierella alpina TaxID=64518 RepID=A0A9P8CYH5_MORAP|nr:hypothetical protein KVV02_006026 [Mortierella alpina]
MSNPDLSRRSSIRAPSGPGRAPNRPPHPSSEGRPLGALQESEQDILSLQQQEELRTRLLDDNFTRAYEPSFDAAPSGIFGSNATASAINVGRWSNAGRYSSSSDGSRGSLDHHEHTSPHHTSHHYQQQQLHQQRIPTPPRAPQLPRPLQGYQQRVLHTRSYTASNRDSMESTPDRRPETPALSTTASRTDDDLEELQSPIDNPRLMDDDDRNPDSYSESDSDDFIDYLQGQGQASVQVHSHTRRDSHYYHPSVSPTPPAAQPIAISPAPESRPRTPILSPPPPSRPRTPAQATSPASRPRTPLQDPPRSRPRTPVHGGASFPRPSTPVYPDQHDGMPGSCEPLQHYTPELETHETLQRERTRIMNRTIVKSSYRRIRYSDISNVQPLKKGGFGEIHTAEWSRLRVVLKRALVEHSEGVEQFDQELEILKRVHDYDYIVPFYGVTIDPHTNVRCMVMKHCTNGNLCTFLEKNHTNITWSERYRLSIEITKGLEFLHKSGFHHRDLHSGNILLDDKRTAMICDFGLSRSSTKAQTSDLVAAVGVASFLAPERFPTKRPIYSAACDIYSLGVIFWHISSGRIPFGKRLREPALLKELMEGHREQIVLGTPREYRDMLVKCWDVNPVKRLKIDVVIAILQTLMAKPTEPVHQVATGYTVPSNTTSAALPVPPELSAKMATLERASNTLNKMVFDIKDLSMKETVSYIDPPLLRWTTTTKKTGTRSFFREQQVPPEPYSPQNPPKTPIYLCPLVGDLAALSYYLSHQAYNPINESSEQTGDTALHLACLFLESPMDTIKVLVELGADINLENLQGYTPVMILVSSNTQYCYEALKYFVMRGARIPAYIRNPITPLNSAQIYALNLVNETRQIHVLGGSNSTALMSASSVSGVGGGVGGMPGMSTPRSRQRVSTQNQNVFQERNGRKVDRLFAQGRPLVHVVAAMQEDYRILDCLSEAGLDPAMSFGGETALVAAAAHLRIKNVEWLLNHDLDISTEAGINRAIKVVKLLHASLNSQENGGPSLSSPPNSSNGHSGGGGGGLGLNNSSGSDKKDHLENIRDLGKYSWAGVAFGEADRMSRDMVGPVLQLLEQWSGNRRITKLNTFLVYVPL